ncbi:MAG: hypothetical protein ACKV0T_17105 [Planctomycetales bacterium]
MLAAKQTMTRPYGLRSIWVQISLASILAEFAIVSSLRPAAYVSGPERTSKPANSAIPEFTEPWKVSGTWLGRRGTNREVTASSDGLAVYEGRGVWSGKIESTERLLDEAAKRRVIGYTLDVLDRFQLEGHRIEDGTTCVLSLSAGTGSVRLRDHGDSNYEGLWAQTRPPRAQQSETRSDKPSPEEPNGDQMNAEKRQTTPIRRSGRPLLAERVHNGQWRITLAVRGMGSPGDSVFVLTNGGHFSGQLLARKRADATLALEEGVKAVFVEPDDRREYLDLAVAAIQSFGFARPRAYKLPEPVALSRARLLIETGRFGTGMVDVDNLIEIQEFDLDNSPQFKTAILKLVDAVKKRVDRAVTQSSE